jgi:hypothetical protein
MAHWQIEIISMLGPERARFEPSDLRARAGDAVAWHNRTNEVFWPWPTDANFVPLSGTFVRSSLYLSDAIQPGQVSRFLYVIGIGENKAIHYCCKLHPDVRGTIILRSGDDEPY